MVLWDTMNGAMFGQQAWSAMGNADGMADDITLSNDEDGVAWS